MCTRATRRALFFCTLLSLARLAIILGTLHAHPPPPRAQSSLCRLLCTFDNGSSSTATRDAHATDENTDAQMKFIIDQLSSPLIGGGAATKKTAYLSRRAKAHAKAANHTLREWAMNALRQKNKTTIESLREARTQRILDGLPKLSPPARTHSMRFGGGDGARIDRTTSHSYGDNESEHTASSASCSPATSISSSPVKSAAHPFRTFEARVIVDDPASLSASSSSACSSSSSASARSSTQEGVLYFAQSTPSPAHFEAPPLDTAGLRVTARQYDASVRSVSQVQHIYELIEQNIIGLACLGNVQFEWSSAAHSKRCLICSTPMPHAHAATYGNRDCPRLSQLFFLPDEQPSGLQAQTSTCLHQQSDKDDLSVFTNNDVQPRDPSARTGRSTRHLMACDNCCVVCNQQAVCIVCLAQRDCLNRFIRAFEKLYDADQQAFRNIDAECERLHKITRIGADCLLP